MFVGGDLLDWADEKITELVFFGIATLPSLVNTTVCSDVDE